MLRPQRTLVGVVVVCPPLVLRQPWIIASNPTRLPNYRGPYTLMSNRRNTVSPLVSIAGWGVGVEGDDERQGGVDVVNQFD